MTVVKFRQWLEGKRKHQDAPGQKTLWDFMPDDEPAPAQKEDPQAIYERGQAKANEFFKSEAEGARDFDRAIFGITEVLQANGRKIDWRYVGSNWHNPLASVAKESLAEVIKMMEWVAKPRSLSYQLTHGLETSSSHYFQMPATPSDTDFQERLDTEARKVIDNDIQYRNQHPTPGWVKVRRNTKAYDAKVALVLDKARKIVKDKWRANIEREIEETENRFKRDKEKNIVYAESAVTHYKNTIADFRALKPDSTVIPELEKMVEEIEQKVKRLKSYHYYEMERLKQAQSQLAQ